jgi:hypothetical protein
MTELEKIFAKRLLKPKKLFSKEIYVHFFHVKKGTKFSFEKYGDVIIDNLKAKIESYES